MVDRFVIVDFGSPRPDVDRVIFCDGAGGDQFRAQEAFPVIARFLGPDGAPVPSRLPPEAVCREFMRGLLESAAAPASRVEAC